MGYEKNVCVHYSKGLALLCLLGLMLFNTAEAIINVTGSNDPVDPDFWTSGGDGDGYSTTGAIGTTADGSLTITGGDTVKIKQVTFGDDAGVTGSLNVDGAGSEFGVQQNLFVGNNGNGTLTVQNGANVYTVVNEVHLGVNSGSSGSLWVTGAGSQFSASDDLFVGNSGDGTLVIEDGAYVESNRHTYISFAEGSESSATVRGEGSEFYVNWRLYVGNYDVGTMNVEDGARVYVDDYGYIGWGAGSTGTVNITGVGSEWEMLRTLYVGRRSMGTLNIENGGFTQPGENVVIALYGTATGTVTVTGEGSKLSAPGVYDEETGISTWGNIAVGYFGNGTLNVEAGGEVESRTSSVGYRYLASDDARGHGVATVTGTGSVWNTAETMIVGNGGDGFLNIENGGVVNSAEGSIGDYYADDLSYGVGTVTVTGTDSAWNNLGGTDGEGNALAGNLYVGKENIGTLNIENGGVVNNAGDAYIGYNTGSAGTAMVSGNGSRWTSSGNLTVGADGTGVLTVSNGGSARADGDISIGTGGRVNLYLDSTGADNLLSAGGALSSMTGSIYIYAAANLAAGDYSPISASTYDDGADHYVVAGGTWDYGDHTFTVAAVQQRLSGVSSEDVSGQRIEFVENDLVVSFGDTAGVVSMNAAEESVSWIDHQLVLKSYYFDLTGGDLSGQTMVVAFYIGLGYQEEQLSFWHEETEGGEWDAYDPESYSYADGWVNFTVDGFSGYAVAVPEFSSLALMLGLASMLLVATRRRKTASLH